MKFVGIDVGKTKCRAAVMDEEGIMIDEFSFTNNLEGIQAFTSEFGAEDRAVMESTGSVWLKLYESLEEQHVPVALANPLKTKAIASAKIKSDKVDARILAHLLRSNLVAESYVPPKPLRELLAYDLVLSPAKELLGSETVRGDYPLQIASYSRMRSIISL